MSGFDISYPAALGAGLLSFLSPCVLPLVPPYLCFLGGLSFDQMTEGTDKAAIRRRILTAALAFVLGFSTVFVALGASATVVGQLIAEHMEGLAKVAGAVILLLGLHFIGLFRIATLYRDFRVPMAVKPAGPLGAYIVGMAFAFGWTPCVGPVLAAILFVAGGEDRILYGASLLGTYALGLGLPFLAATVAINGFLRLSRRLRPWMHTVEKITGLLLVGTGILFLTGGMAGISQWLLTSFPVLARIG
jgi:cytochrome c-type biogenesis protein